VIDFDAATIGSLTEAPARWCAVVGNEDRGISVPVRDACEASGGGLLRINMASGVDSLAITVSRRRHPHPRPRRARRRREEKVGVE